MVVPTFEWLPVINAAYYKVEVSTAINFLVMEATYDTYSTRTTPVDTLVHGIHYWRVIGVDAEDHVGGNNWRKFTLIAPPAATDTTPQLSTPLNAETIAGDPIFIWTRMIEAHHYRLVVSTQADFTPSYSIVTTDYSSYTPTVATSPDAYPNGTYYWKVEARTSDGTVISTSSAWTVIIGEDVGEEAGLYLPLVMKYGIPPVL